MDISRRNFLKAGAVASALGLGGAALAGCSSPSSASESKAKAKDSAEYDPMAWLGEAPDLTPEQCDETVETEVLVVGSALAGSMAAYGAVKNGAKVKVVFPVEGAIFPGESVQILKNCKHPENAKKFVDYMLSEKVQNAVGMNLTVRPLRKGATLADYMTPNDKIKLAPNYDEKWVSENKAKITKMFSEHMEKSL